MFPFKNVPNFVYVGSMLGTLDAFNGAHLPNLPNIPNLTAWAHMHMRTHVHTRARMCIHKNTLGMLGRLGRFNRHLVFKVPHIFIEVRKVGN